MVQDVDGAGGAKVNGMRWRQLFDQAPGFMCVLAGPLHIFEFANPAYHSLVGRGDLAGRPLAEALPWTREQGFLQLLDEVYASGRPYRADAIEVKVPARPEREAVRYLDFVYQPLSDETGRTTGIFVLGSDVTERVCGEQRLRRQQALLEAQKKTLEMVVKGAPLHEVLTALALTVEEQAQGEAVASILLVDDEGRLRNGASPSLPAHYLDAIDGLEVQAHLGTCCHAAATNTVVETPAFESDPYWRDLKHLPLDIGFKGAWSQPITARDGTVVGTFSTYFRSVRTPSPEERQNVEILARTAALAIERVKALDEINEASRRKDEFLATLAHELRNPLAPIRTGLDLMKMVKGDAGVMEATRQLMERQTDLLIMLVNDLLDISRITRGHLELRKKRVRLADILRTSVEASSEAIEKAGHSFQLNLPDRDIWLYADEHRLSQVFTNLLNNAAKYTPSNGAIHLAARVKEGHVLVSVKDNGIGIPAEMRNRVFEPFAQINRSLDSDYTGLGIGLTIVKSLVESHGGRVRVTSEGRGRGSTFIVRLPLSRQPVEDPALEASAAAARQD